MRPTIVPRGRDLSGVAERQMRTWALQLQAQQQLAEQEAVETGGLIYPYLALSREAGIDAGALAAEIASPLGWKRLDGELLDHMADHYHWSRKSLEMVDERTVSWFHETLGRWLDEQRVSQAEYVTRLGQIVLLAAQHESTVFVGRGAQFLLPRDAGLAVRIIAPKKQRVQWVMKRRQLGRPEAEKLVDEVDQGRDEFARRYFLRDVADPHLYDLVVNLECLPRQGVVELIIEQCRRRFRVATRRGESASGPT